MINNEFDDQDPTLSDLDAGEAGIPLGSGEFGTTSGFATSDEPSVFQRHAGGALLLTAVVAVAIVGLFSMRTLTRASAAVDAPSDVEKSIESFIKLIEGGQFKGIVNTTGSDIAVIDVLSESYTQRQVALEDVQRNPFIIFEEGESAPKKTVKDDVDPRIEQRRIRQEQIERAAGRLRLGSIMMGSRPLANINNQVLRVGDLLTVPPDDVVFVITAIESTSVHLLSEDPALQVTVPVTLSIRRD